MGDGLMLAAILALVVMIGTPIAAVAGLVMARRLDGEVRTLRRRLGAAELALARLGDEGQRPAPPPPAVKAPAPSAAEPPVAPPPAEASPPRMSTERLLTERWLVWLGGITLALGGAFLVKFSVEQGWLVPAVRVMLGGLAGIGAAGLGHWLSRRPALAGGGVWHVPPALVGAGAAMVFASLYAAYGLYALIGPLAAFAGLALTAAATVVLSLGHGPFVALLGLLGAFAVPLLVRSPEPDAAGLFAYLLILSAGALALLRWRQWWWLARVTLAGAAGWIVLWLAMAWRPGDEAVLGLFLCALFGLFAAFRRGVPGVAPFAHAVDAPMVRQVVAVAAAVVAALAVPVVDTAGYSPMAVALPFAVAAAFLAFGWRDPVFDRVPWLAAALAVLVLAGWDAGLPDLDTVADILERPLPHEAARFVSTALAAAALFAAAGFIAAGRCARPWRWAALSGATPLAILAVAYWRLSTVASGWHWAGGAVALAALLLAAAERIGRRRDEDGMDGALAAYAIAVLGALALAATFALEEAWLTVALALMVAGTAWVDQRLRVAGLRRVALLLAAAVLIRLALNPYILDYPIGDRAVVDWLPYGYGIPLAAFAVAARLFRRTADDVLVAVLEAGTIAFAVLLVSLEIRTLTVGSLAAAGGYSLAERSLDTIAWLGGAALLFVIHARNGRWVPLRGGQALLVLATAQAVYLQALFGNPLLTGAAVGETAVLNQLLPSFAAPALLYALHARVAPTVPSWTRTACAALGLGFAYLWALLELRHAFVGSHLRTGAVGQAEQWAYSALTLLGGVAILVGAIRRNATGFRRAGLAVVLVVVAKVFLVDLSQTSGLWRALSVLCLGATLVGIGWLYRRFAQWGEAPR
ncbi:MAG: DUF2339 domain-containing protein [Magnetospirillum sp.]|nr:DUF2339 domain-containing protein [Magnetospirillum sp.]